MDLQRRDTEAIIDETIAKCNRIQEVNRDINQAFEEIIAIFKQAARDCGYEEESDD